MDELSKRDVQIHYNTEVVDFKANGKKIKSVIDKDEKEWSAKLY